MRLRLLWIAWRNNRLLFLLPVIVFYLILPLLTISTAVNQNIEESWILFVFILQTLAPISAIFWLIAYLNLWLDEDGEECIRSSQVKKSSCAGEVALTLLLFALITLPIFGVANFYYDTVFFELLRLISATSFLVSVLYLFALLFRSLTIASMLVFSYAIFSITYSRDEAIQHLCLLRPHVAASAEQILSIYLPLVIVSILLVMLGFMMERKFHFYRP